MKNRILREYIESLKEDNELDYIFPILLQAMGFRIVSTPRILKDSPSMVRISLLLVTILTILYIVGILS